jgi:hypothetical protein
MRNATISNKNCQHFCEKTHGRGKPFGKNGVILAAKGTVG